MAKVSSQVAACVVPTAPHRNAAEINSYEYLYDCIFPYVVRVVSASYFTSRVKDPQRAHIDPAST